MRALVTGAGGFIGSHLVEHLVQDCGADVRAFVHYRGDGRAGWLDESNVRDRIEIVAGDVRDAQAVAAAARGCAVLYHLAAQASVAYSYDAPGHVLDVNAGGTLAALLAARAHGCRLLHMSSSEVYGTAQRVPIDEAHPIAPQSPYAASKVAAEALCRAFHASYGVDVRVARCFNTYGPRQSLRAVIPNVIAQILAGRYAVRVGTLEATRDFTAVADTARALVALATATDARCAPGPINVGNGRETTIAELVERCGRVLGVATRPVVDPDYMRPAASEVMRLCCDAASMRSITDWQPAVTLDEGIAGVAHWLRERPEARRLERVA